VAETRRRRPKGEASRERILDAAAEIAGERGYEGTSINLISERSGLPASSIYWHFKDKDELIAAVIDRSFHGWFAAIQAPLEVPEGASRADVFHLGMQRSGDAIAQFPDFLRLGLMLVLEQRPEEPTARTRFIETRRETRASVRGLYKSLFPDLSTRQREALITLTIALSDGLFVAQEAGEVDLGAGFDLLATAILGAANELRAARPTPKKKASKPRR
jgi:AcrR family transcriptional regulator